MPGFTLTAHAHAPVEEVWKLLHDPARFPEWWAGVDKVAPGPGGEYTMWPDGYPDFPMRQQIAEDRAGGRVVISCLVSDLSFVWRLRADGDDTDIDVEVGIPDREAHRLPAQREMVSDSLAALTALAEAFPAD
ncbi:SRPBCC family protein [Actinoplanes sp. CA-030573]|uniref:SRPBCC family protein n=1 Tax=Actinoplanes sp. CA-030573 TaxID=3239898 RepID=UPI003D902164